MFANGACKLVFDWPASLPYIHQDLQHMGCKHKTRLSPWIFKHHTNIREENGTTCFTEFEEISRCQRKNADMAAMIAYLQYGTLVNEEKVLRRVVILEKQAI